MDSDVVWQGAAYKVVRSVGSFEVVSLATGKVVNRPGRRGPAVFGDQARAVNFAQWREGSI